MINLTVNKAPLLYAITNRAMHPQITLKDACIAAIDAGISLLQLRDKLAGKEEIVKLAEELLPLCREKKVRLIINDNPEIAKNSGADGVHLGQSDMPCIKARNMLGINSIIGVTAKTIDEAKSAENDGADYIGCGRLFSTETKPDAIPISIDLLNKISSEVNIPVFAIGGINQDNIRALKTANVAGFAISEGIFNCASDDTDEIKRNVAKLQEAISEF